MIVPSYKIKSQDGIFWQFSLPNALGATRSLYLKSPCFCDLTLFWIINFLQQKLWVHFFFFPYSIQRESFTELLDRTRFLSQKYTRYYIVDICVVVLQLERLMTWIKIRRLSHLRPLLTGPSDIQTMTVPTMSVRVAQQTTAVQPSSI